MRDNLVRSTPFRVALILAATVFASLVIAGLVALQLVRSELAGRIDRTLAESFEVIAQAYGHDDLTDLIDSVKSHAEASPSRERVFALVSPTGDALAGNVSALPPAVGWTTAPATSLGLSGVAEYRLLVGDVAGNRLLVGQSLDEVHDIAQLVLVSILWAGVLILALVMGVGGLLAVRAQRRINRIAATMTLIGHGDLTARIPVSVRGDDIDVLSGRVNEALDRLSALVDGMRQVSINIAHDLKTPLNRLAISVETAVARAKEPPLVDLLDQAANEIRQINSTFDALLRIAQIEAGARRERFVAVDLSTTFERIRDAYVDVADERQQSLIIEWQPALPRIDGDADLLVQLCANLVENALRHGPPGTRVTLSARRLGDTVEMVCADDGPGIPDSERDKVFERLYRIDKSRSTPGSGLGLSLVKAIVELHRASITLAHNNPGMRVVVRFPVSTGAAPGGPSP